MLYKSEGMLRYYSPPYKLIVEVDQEIGRLYRSLIPKYMSVNLPMYPTHITVVRSEKETPVILEPWGRYDGEKIEYYYDPEVKIGTVYYWLNVFCRRLEEIRAELGMSVDSIYTKPPEGFLKCFHITIGNSKNVPINTRK